VSHLTKPNYFSLLCRNFGQGSIQVQRIINLGRSVRVDCQAVFTLVQFGERNIKSRVTLFAPDEFSLSLSMFSTIVRANLKNCSLLTGRLSMPFRVNFRNSSEINSSGWIPSTG
jgi:hypothetical protein